MLRVSFRRVKPGKEAQLRAWLAERTSGERRVEALADEILQNL